MTLETIAFYGLTYWVPGIGELIWIFVRRKKIKSWYRFLWQQTIFTLVLFNYFLLIYWIDTVYARIYASIHIAVLLQMYGSVLGLLWIVSGIAWVVIRVASMVRKG